MMQKGLMLSSIVLLLICCYGYSQTNEEGYQSSQFNFFPPGARAMAMGGAFIGLADDASAAYYNPSGLMILNKKEICLASWLSKHYTYTASDPDVFTTGSLTATESDIDGGPLFTSIVIPFDNLRIGIYYANISMSEFPDIKYYARPIPGTSNITLPSEGHFDFVSLYFSTAVALKLNDNIYIGASINYVLSTISNTLIFHEINPTNLADLTQNPLFELRTEHTQEGKFGFTLGTFIMPIENLSIGLVYNYNPKYNYTQSRWVPDYETGINTNDDINLTFNIPDKLGAGIAYRPIDELVIVADIVYAMYEQLTENMISSFDEPSGIKRGDDISDIYKASNATEFHLGIEYAIYMGKTPLFLRAGIFVNPDHSIKYTGQSTTGIEPYLWNLSDYSDDIKDPDLVLTGGIGINIDSNFQIDAAYYDSYLHKRGMLSFVYRF